jgi:photosystem II stability/assembly factor-like uncharacterized protein
VERQSPTSCRGYVCFYLLRGVPNLGRSIVVVALAAASMAAIPSAASAGVNNPLSGWYWGNPLLGPNRLTDLECAGSTCYAAGESGTVLKSSDGGVTWDGIITGLTSNVLRLRLIGGDSSRIVTGRTDDDGDTFTMVEPSKGRIEAVEFASPTRAIAVGDVGRATISDDAGKTWRSVDRYIDVEFTALHAASGTLAYAGGANGVLVRTTDAGQSWENVGTPTAARITGIAAPTPDGLFVLADDGVLQRSDNGGASYRLLDAGTARALGIAG